MRAEYVVGGGDVPHLLEPRAWPSILRWLWKIAIVLSPHARIDELTNKPIRRGMPAPIDLDRRQSAICSAVRKRTPGPSRISRALSSRTSILMAAFTSANGRSVDCAAAPDSIARRLAKRFRLPYSARMAVP